MLKKILFIFLTIIFFKPALSFAHSGRTNSDGCHNDNINGGYHCHNSVPSTPSYKTYYLDSDGDGYGNPYVSKSSTYQPSGYVLNNTDHNDNDRNSYPGATEIRGDGIDQDGDGRDLPSLLNYYFDFDGDGFGDYNTPIQSSSQPSGYVSDNTDCNDSDSTIHPGATEIRGDGIDQDCNGSDLPSLLTQTQVSQLYVSIFGRASEDEGNAYWCSEQDNMTNAANTMLATDAAQSYFGPTLNNNQAFIEFIFENTLGKTNAEDPTGVNYWVSELANGKSKGEVIASLISAVMEPIYTGVPAQNRFINMVTVCNYVADNISTCPDVNDLSAFVLFISGVTYDNSTVEAAMNSVQQFLVDVDVTGNYTGIWHDSVGDFDNFIIILNEDYSFSFSDSLSSGSGTYTVSDSTFNARINFSGGEFVDYTGIILGNSISGTFTSGGGGSNSGTFTMSQ